MSISYNIAFPQEMPSVEQVLNVIIQKWESGLYVKRNNKSFSVFFKEINLMDIFLMEQPNYYELSFGKYEYKAEWYMPLGKNGGLYSDQLYVEIVGYIVDKEKMDFLAIYENDKVILQREDGCIYRNLSSLLWPDKDMLHTLVAGKSYTEIAY